MRVARRAVRTRVRCPRPDPAGFAGLRDTRYYGARNDVNGEKTVEGKKGKEGSRRTGKNESYRPALDIEFDLSIATFYSAGITCIRTRASSAIDIDPLACRDQCFGLRTATRGYVAYEFLYRLRPGICNVVGVRHGGSRALPFPSEYRVTVHGYR